MKKLDLMIVRKGVIVLPKRVREELDLEEGDVLRVKVEEGKIVLMKEDFWGKLLGCARGLYDLDEVELELDRGEAY